MLAYIAIAAFIAAANPSDELLGESFENQEVLFYDEDLEGLEEISFNDEDYVFFEEEEDTESDEFQIDED